MKGLDNHFYLLIAHVITLLGIQIIDFSIISIICIVITLFYLLIAKHLRKINIFNYFVQLFLYSLIPFCYSTERLISRINLHPVSIINIVLILIIFIAAIKITRTRKESYLNVRNKYTEEKILLKKANNFASRCMFFIMLPLFLLIFYFDWLPKLIITVGLLFAVTIVIYIYTIVINHKYQQIVMNKEVN